MRHCAGSRRESARCVAEKGSGLRPITARRSGRTDVMGRRREPGKACATHNCPSFWANRRYGTTRVERTRWRGRAEAPTSHNCWSFWANQRYGTATVSGVLRRI
jgi:hypothetical protein